MKRLLLVLLVVTAMTISTFAAWNGDWNTWQKVDVSVLPAYKPLSEAAITVPKVTGKITIDGQPTEPDWKNAAVISLNEDAVEDWQMFGTQVQDGAPPDDADDCSGLFYFLYDSTTLYCFAVISDEKMVSASSEKHKNDAIELFFDPDNLKNAPNQKYYGPTGLLDNSDAEYCQTENSVAKRGRWEKGWTLEWNVLMDDIKAGLAPLDGKTIGFDVQLDDSDDKSAGRETALVWAGGQNQNWLTAQYYGQMTFAK